MLDLQHNVVNILYVIKGAIENCLGRAEEGDFKTAEQALLQTTSTLKRIYAQVEKALAITKRISLAMKAQRNSEDPVPEVSVKETWREAVRILKNQYPFGNLEIIEHIPDEYPLIKCDQHDLLEIFYTLLQNAVQAMGVPKPGEARKLIIRANLQFLAGENPMAVIAVSDTGPGIPEEVLSRIFEPFFTTKSPEEGNGLGLCLVKSLAKRNAGSVCASSFKGCGTTITLSFQAARPSIKEGDVRLAVVA